MKGKRLPILSGGFWEVLRFLFLFFLLTRLGSPSSGNTRHNALWLLLFGSGQLVLAAGFLFLYLDPARYAALTGFLILAKVLSVFSALLLVFLEPAGGRLSLVPLLAIWIVVFLDLVVLGILLSARSSLRKTESPPATRAKAPDEDGRPDFSETDVDSDDPPPT